MFDVADITAESLLQAHTLNRQFMLVLADMEKDAQGNIKVSVLPDSQIAITGAGRKQFETQKKRWRWAAGGAFMILQLKDCAVGLTRYRDKGAPSWGDHYTLGSGLSAELDELLHPLRLALREGVEEFLIATPEGRVVPRLEGAYSKLVMTTALANWTLVEGLTGLPELFTVPKAYVAPAELVALPQERHMDVSLDDMGSASRGLIVLDEGTRGIDIVTVMKVDLSRFALDEISILDGETNREGKSLNGEVVCFLMRGEKFAWFPAMAFQNGHKMNASSHSRNATPVLRAVIDALS